MEDNTVATPTAKAVPAVQPLVVQWQPPGGGRRPGLGRKPPAAMPIADPPIADPLVNSTFEAGSTDGSGPATETAALAKPAGEALPPPAKPARANAYPATAAVPTQAGPDGIRFDFNMGARITLPAGQWHVRLRDLDTGNILFETDTQNAVIHSTKRYFVRFGMQVWKDGQEVLNHTYSARDQEVLVQFPVGTLGDLVAWFPYAVRFQQVHGCKLTVAMGEKIIPLFRDAYPDVRFATHDEVEEQKLNERFYATYSMGLFFDDADGVWQPSDFRHVGLHRTAGYILGVDPTEERPRLHIEDDTRPIAEPYVVIAAQSSSQCKYWNNPHGWREIIKFLKETGYRVVCIDQMATHGTGLVWNQLPHGVEDHTGDRGLQERARWLKHAAFFIGLSSGLSWLAWAADIPVVLISGFTHPTNEFETPYRVINYHACNSCWNDVRHRFEHNNFLWCPRHANTDRQFECTKLITPDQVKSAIRRIPQFGQHAPAAATVH